MRDKVGTFLLEVLLELLKSHISFVHQIEGAGFNRDFIYSLGIIDLTGGEQNKGGNRAPVHQRMYLERSFPVLELSLGAQLQTQLDSGAIKRIDLLLKTNPQFFIFVKRSDFLYQSHRKVLIDTPVLFLLASASEDQTF